MIERIANVNSAIANATPHVLFIVGVSIIKLFFPYDVITWIACETAITKILQWYYPIIATILLIQDLSEEEKQQHHDHHHESSTMGYNSQRQQQQTVTPNNSSKAATSAAHTTSSSFFPRTQPSGARQSTLVTSTPAARSRSSRWGIPARFSSTKKSVARQQQVNQPSSSSTTSSMNEQTPERKSRLLALQYSSSVSRRKRQQQSPKSTASSFSSGSDYSSSLGTSLIDYTIIENRISYWVHYWIVVIAISCSKCILHLIPLAARIVLRYQAVSIVLQQLELVFWIWLNSMPPSIIMTAESGRKRQPILMLDYLACTVIQPVFQKVYTNISTVVSIEAWDTYIVQNATKFSVPIVWMKLITQENVDFVLHLVSEFRCMVIPTLLVCSWPISSYGVAYAQYGLPLAKINSTTKNCGSSNDNNTVDQQQHRTNVQWLQFFIIHSLVSGLIYKFATILWWIPFSNVLIYGIYTILTLIKGMYIETIYILFIQKELQAFGLLHPTNTNNGDDDEQQHPSIHETKIMSFLHWIISKLPSASDDLDNNDDNIMHNDSNDDENNNPSRNGSASDYNDDGDDDAISNHSSTHHFQDPENDDAFMNHHEYPNRRNVNSNNNTINSNTESAANISFEKSVEMIDVINDVASNSVSGNLVVIPSPKKTASEDEYEEIYLDDDEYQNQVVVDDDGDDDIDKDEDESFDSNYNEGDDIVHRCRKESEEDDNCQIVQQPVRRSSRIQAKTTSI